jgi:hypothetical protein
LHCWLETSMFICDFNLLIFFGYWSLRLIIWNYFSGHVLLSCISKALSRVWNNWIHLRIRIYCLLSIRRNISCSLWKISTMFRLVIKWRWVAYYFTYFSHLFHFLHFICSWFISFVMFIYSWILWCYCFTFLWTLFIMILFFKCTMLEWS